MRFSTVGNVLYLILGIIFLGAGLITLLYGVFVGDGGSMFYGLVLLLIGGARTFWSIARMRAVSRYKAQLQARQMAPYGYAPQPGYPPQQPGYPPQQPGYPPQQPGYTPQPGYPPQYPAYPQSTAYPPQPEQYGAQYPAGQYPAGQYPQYPTQPSYPQPTEPYPPYQPPQQ